MGKSELTALFIRIDGQKEKQPKADDTELLFPATREAQVGNHKFETSTGYIMRARSAWEK